MRNWHRIARIIAFSGCALLQNGGLAWAQDYVGSDACRDCHDEQVQAWADPTTPWPGQSPRLTPLWPTSMIRPFLMTA